MLLFLKTNFNIKLSFFYYHLWLIEYNKWKMLNEVVPFCIFICSYLFKVLFNNLIFNCIDFNLRSAKNHYKNKLNANF